MNTHDPQMSPRFMTMSTHDLEMSTRFRQLGSKFSHDFDE